MATFVALIRDKLPYHLVYNAIKTAHNSLSPFVAFFVLLGIQTVASQLQARQKVTLIW